MNLLLFQYGEPAINMYDELIVDNNDARKIAIDKFVKMFPVQTISSVNTYVLPVIAEKRNKTLF